MFIDINIPEYPLRTFIRSIIYYKDYTADCNYEMLLPDGSCQLIISLDENDRYVEDVASPYKTRQSFKNYWVTGIQTRPVVYAAEKNATTLCIQFENGGLSAFFDIPAHEFKDQMVDASLFMSCELQHLREKLLKGENHQRMMSITTAFLEQRLVREVENSDFLSFVIKKMCEENQSLLQVVRQTGYSQKHLIHKFKTLVGITPKKYQKLFRFNKALRFMQQADAVNYSDIVFSCNYYDQAHFVNDFHTMTARNPSQYLRIEKDYPHVLPLNTLR